MGSVDKVLVKVAAKNGTVYLENNSDSPGGILEVKLN